MSVLTSSALRLAYGKVLVVETPPLHLSRGQVVGVLGANGAGKSTLLRTLAGVQPPAEGEICVEGTPLHAASAHERARKVALLLTDRVALAHLSVRELVALGRYPYTSWWGHLREEDLSRIDEALHALNLTGFALRAVASLSDGERQRVMLARALAQGAPVLLADEPTAHLDAPGRIEIMHLLRDLAHRHRAAVLVATHEIAHALALCDRLWLVHQGRLVEGLPEELASSGLLDAAFSRPGVPFHAVPMGGHTPTGAPLVSVSGEGPLVRWTHALVQRLGLPDGKGGTPLHVLAAGWRLGEDDLGSWAALEGRLKALHAPVEGV